MASIPTQVISVMSEEVLATGVIAPTINFSSAEGSSEPKALALALLLATAGIVTVTQVG